MRGALYRLSDRAVVGRSGRFCPSDSKFKASRVASYTTDPMWHPREDSNFQSPGSKPGALANLATGVFGRFGWGRTIDHPVIGRVLYQTELRSEIGAFDQFRTGYL